MHTCRFGMTLLAVALGNSWAGFAAESVPQQIERIQTIQRSYKEEKAAGRTERAAELAKQRDGLILAARGQADARFRAALSRRRIAEAEAILNEALPLLTTLSDDYSSQYQQQEQLAESLRQLGDYYASQGQWQLAHDRFLRALTLEDSFRFPTRNERSFRGYDQALQKLGKLAESGKLQPRAEVHRLFAAVTKARDVATMNNHSPTQEQFEQAESLSLQYVEAVRHAFPKHPPLLVAVYSSLANISEQLKNFERMEKYDRQIELLAEIPLDPAEVRYPTAQSYGSTFRLMGLRRSRRGKHEEAIATLERAARYFETDPKFPTVPGEVWEDLGKIYQRRGEYDKAELYLQRRYEQILDLRKTQLNQVGKNHYESLRDYGHILVGRGKYQKAEEVFRLALDLASQSNSFKAALTELFGMELTLVNLKAYQGEFAEAEKQVTHVKAHLARVFKPGDPHAFYVLDQLALIYESQGRLAEAEKFWKQKLAQSERLRLFNNGNNFTNAALQLSEFYVRQQRFAESRVLLDDLIDQLNVQEMDRHFRGYHLGKTHLHLAEVYAKRGDDANALRVLNAGLMTVQDFADGRLVFLAERIRRKIKLGDFEGAKKDLHVCLTNLSILGEAGDTYRFRLLLDEARLQASTGDPLAAAERMRKVAKEQSRASGGAAAALSLSQMVELLLELKHTEQAAVLLADAVDYQDWGLAPFGERARSRQLKAQLLWQSGKRNEALKTLQEALNLAEKQRQAASTFAMDQATMFANFQPAFERMIDWQLQAGDVAAAFAAAEQSSARSLVEQLAQEFSPLSNIPAVESVTLRERSAVAQSRVSALRGQLEFAKSEQGLPPVEYERRIAVIGRELEAARQDVVAIQREILALQRSDLVRSAETLAPVELRDLQPWLADRSAVVLQYVLGEQDGYCFVIRGALPVEGHRLSVSENQAREMGIEPGPLTLAKAGQVLTIKPQNKTVNELLANRLNCDLAYERLHQLWALLVPAEVRQELLKEEKGFRQLIIVPNGPLASLPFEALICELAENKEPRYLLDLDVLVAYAFSSTTLFNLGQKPRPAPVEGQPSSILSVAIDADAKKGAEGATHFMEEESDWVGEHFAKLKYSVHKLRGPEATEAKVRAKTGNHFLMHFACHGIADPAAGNLWGALLLNPGQDAAKNSENDGRLTTGEINVLDLRGCELAILSACETNLGHQQRGEGAWTLSRAFVVAGARRTVATNWKVDNISSAYLVRDLTSHVANGLEKGSTDYAAALHAARTKLRQTSEWKSPHFWAPFVLVGTP